MQHAHADSTPADDYQHNYPYPESARHAPMQLPPQHVSQRLHVQHHRPPAPAPPEEPGFGTHARNVQQSMQVPDHDAKSRTECAQLKQQTAAMQAQLAQLQKRIAEDEQTRSALNQSLASVNGKVGDLSSQLNYWKQEVQRIDADAEAQHLDDMATLESISEIISQLPQPETAAARQRSRY